MSTRRDSVTIKRGRAILLLGVFAVLLGTRVGHTKEPRTWRHEGLLIDLRDVARIQGQPQQDPWRTARADLDRRVQSAPLSADDPGNLLALSLDYALGGREEDGRRLAERFEEFTDARAIRSEARQPGEIARTAVTEAIVLESLHRYEGFPKEKRETHGAELAVRLEELSESASGPASRAWLGAARMAVGVVRENAQLYQEGERTFLSLLKNEFRDSGAPVESLTLDKRVELASGLLVMAEIANHHSDLFWGHDLYHESIGPRNLTRICMHLLERVKESPTDPRTHWGWLELAAKTFGEPAMLTVLEGHRPVFDPWAGGAVTLTHARALETGLHDFGVAEDGFHWLANRKDLTGWQYSSRWYEIDREDFYVKDGVFHTQGARDHWLMTDRMFKDFVLRLEYRLGPGSNSGIFIWSPIPGRPSKTGFEIQLLDDAGKEPSPSGSGALYKVEAPLVNTQRLAGEWNQVEIHCEGSQLRVVLNGQTVQDINLDDYPVTQGRRRRGYIGLQDHSHRVAFRNVRILPL